MNRICPTEKVLSEYLSGLLSEETRRTVEKHLTSCSECRTLISEANKITGSFDLRDALYTALSSLRRNKWLIVSILFFISSFLFSKHFLQLLAACTLTGLKWIIDSKTTKMLITVYEAWKSTNKSDPEHVSSHFQKK